MSTAACSMHGKQSSFSPKKKPRYPTVCLPSSCSLLSIASSPFLDVVQASTNQKAPFFWSERYVQLLVLILR